MRRIVVAIAALATSVALAAPADAWPPVCKPIVYDNTGICV